MQERPSHKLAHKWTFWEIYKLNKSNQNEDWKSTLFSVFNFEDIENFALLWNRTSYNKISEFFFDQVSKLTKK